MFLDIGLGIFAAIAVSKLFMLPLTGQLIFLGIIFAFLPDADYLVHLAKSGSSRNAHRHRDLFHLPLLYIPSGFLLLVWWDPAWAAFFVFGSLGHFLHDSIGIGWGVQWLYPFTTDHYTFFYRYTGPQKPAFPLRILYTWKHSDIDTLAKAHGDEDWIRNIYLLWHPYAIIEFIVFVVALAMLYSTLR